MARKKELYTVHLEPWQIGALRDRRTATGMPVAAQIRQAVDQYLERLGRRIDDDAARAAAQEG